MSGRQLQIEWQEDAERLKQLCKEESAPRASQVWYGMVPEGTAPRSKMPRDVFLLLTLRHEAHRDESAVSPLCPAALLGVA